MTCSFVEKVYAGELGEIAAIPGSGPKRVKLLYDKLKVRTLDDLRGVLAAGRLGEIRGFGPIIEKKIFAALEKPRAQKRFKLAVAEAEALMYAVRIDQARRAWLTVDDVLNTRSLDAL